MRLSQSHIPPGDPVLTVEVPADAREVVAHFPFGLIKPLRHDAIRGRWAVRFLVPRDVPDGQYRSRVLIVHADGRRQWKSVPYAIDSTAPELEVIADELAIPGEDFRIEVDPLEPVREVTVELVGHPGTRVRLTLDPVTGRHLGRLRVPGHVSQEILTLKVIARDLARNRVERLLEISVLPDPGELGC